MTMWRRLAPVLAAAALGLAACGRPAAPGGENKAAPAGGERPFRQEATFTLNLTEFRIEPAVLEVARDTRVTLKVANRGYLVHDLAVPDFGAATPALRPGMQAELTFVADRAGEFQVVCKVPGHAEQHMRGRLVVR